MSDDLVSKRELRSMIRKASAVYVPAAFHGDRMAFVKVSKSEALRALKADYDDYPDDAPEFSAQFGGPDGKELSIA